MTFPCSFTGCPCECFSVPPSTASLSAEEFLQHASIEVRDCSTCRHGLTWHRGARKGLSSGVCSLQMLVEGVTACVESSPQVPSRSSAAPKKNEEAPATPAAPHACKFKECTCRSFVLGREAEKVVGNFQDAPANLQLCVVCSHGPVWHDAARAIRSEGPTKFVDRSRSCLVGSSPTVPAQPGPVNAFQCKFRGCACESYTLDGRARTLTNEEFIERAPPYLQQCASCQHGPMWHPNITAALRQKDVLVHALVSSSDTPAESPQALLAACTLRPSSDVHKQLQATSVDPPPDMLCPITQELMESPVVLVDGHSYEQEAIESWLKCHDISPMTSLPLSSKIVIPNHCLKKLIVDWQDRNAVS
eukprot:TRINITY_DN1979_c0_g1_i1.p1 TRINITY_DN1979_c0_g1~~TRINITY_DN1979_c0_g1_i1.p1  ORF type:complete len:361 (+),score=39.19 TRINITY_DN1979_c0_g1_i1:59-1141(+)